MSSNLETYKFDMVYNTFKYLSYLARQIGCILLGVISPFYILNSPYPWFVLLAFVLITPLLQMGVSWVSMLRLNISLDEKYAILI